MPHLCVFLQLQIPSDPCTGLCRLGGESTPGFFHIDSMTFKVLPLGGSRSAVASREVFQGICHLVAPMVNCSLPLSLPVAKGSSCSSSSPCLEAENYGMFTLSATSRDFLSRHLPPTSTNNMSYAYSVV